MADLDDMEMLKCPVCGKSAPKDYYPLCTCGSDEKAGKKQAKTAANKKKKKEQPKDPYDY